MSSDSFEMLGNRVRKRRRHLAKWARRTGVSCYRVYDRDLPDQPLIVEWYDGDAVIWAFDRTRDDTEEKDHLWVTLAVDAIARALDLPDENVFVKRRRRQRGRQPESEGEGQYQRFDARRYVRYVDEGGLTFEVNLSEYLDTGLFLHHRETRRLVREASDDRLVLNLFGYTGAFAVHAAAGGARHVVSVDLSNTYADWAERNLVRNGFTDRGRHPVVTMEAFAFLAEARRRGRVFDLIVCDPPTFSASKSMTSTFAVARDHPALLTECASVLAPGGTLLFSTNARRFELLEEGLPDLPVKDITARTTPEDFKGRPCHRAWTLGAPLAAR